MANVGLYIHIPFCKSICTYCDFCKVLYHEEWALAYLKCLKEEIQARYMGEVINTIYIGGGTPSSLTYKQIEELLSFLQMFVSPSLEEFTFECNIEDINKTLLNLLKKYGVNRLSIGIESFNEENLLLMRRKNNYEDTKEKIKLIREVGFNNINLDLIYALPKESLKILKQDLKLLTSLNPEHISTYSLMILDNTFLNYQQIKNINEDDDAKMYQYIGKYLVKLGYEHYEVSNFAKKGYEAKHNLIYWQNKEYYGFGCGASGYINGVRYDNTRSLSNYLKGEYKSSDTLLAKKEIMEYELILGLRLLKGLNIREFYDKYKVNMQDVFPIKPLLKNGDLIYKDGYIAINPNKIYVMDEILLKLV